MNILKDVLSLPTAPFHEEAVAAYIKKTCKRLKADFRIDKYGNIIARYKRGEARQPVILTAHMDHPGFEVIKGGGKKCEVGILGGVNLKFFKGAKVLIQTADGPVKGIVKKQLKKKWMGKPAFEVAPSPQPSPSRDEGGGGGDKAFFIHKGYFGWYDLPGFKLKNGIVHTKSADNLASTAALLDLLARLKKKRITADVRCVFTRAEEVGFVGCTALAKSGILPKRMPIIVLECSSAKAGRVEIGGGPVIRVGDKLLCYNSDVDLWLKSIAIKLSKKEKKFKFQRALLGGGTCEASVWTIKGHKSGGLAFPLGNYHNNGDRGYAPEYVSTHDYNWMLDFLTAIATAETFHKALKRSSQEIARHYHFWKERL